MQGSQDSTADDSSDDMVAMSAARAETAEKKKGGRSSNKGGKKKSSSDKGRSSARGASGLSAETEAKLAALEAQEKSAQERTAALAAKLAEEEREHKRKREAKEAKLKSILSDDDEKVKVDLKLPVKIPSPRRVVTVDAAPPRSPRSSSPSNKPMVSPRKSPRAAALLGAAVDPAILAAEEKKAKEAAKLKVGIPGFSKAVKKEEEEDESSEDSSSSSSSSDDDSSDIDLAALAKRAGLGGGDDELAELAALEAEREEVLDEEISDEEERELMRLKREAKLAKKKAARKAEKKRMRKEREAALKVDGEQYYDNVLEEGDRQREEQRRIKRIEESRKKAAKLRFIGQQFSNMKVDIQAIVEEEKQKQQVYDFEWERKEQNPEWKQGLLKAGVKPQEGLDYLVQRNLIEDSLESRANWISHYRVNILDNEAVVDWMSRAENYNMLEAVMDHELKLSGLDIEMAFRKLIWTLDVLPADSESLKRVLKAFGDKYRADNTTRNKVRTTDAAVFITNAMLVLSTAVHNDGGHATLSDFVSQCSGRNDGQDFDAGMLHEIFDNVMASGINFRVSCQFPNALKMGFCLVRSYNPTKRKDKSHWRRRWCVLTEDALEVRESPSSEVLLDLELGSSTHVSGIQSAKPVFGLREEGEDVIHAIQPNVDWAFERWNSLVRREARKSTEVEGISLPETSGHHSLVSPRKKGSPFRKGKKGSRLSTRGKNTIDLTASPSGLAAPRIDRTGERVKNFDSEESDE